MSAVIKYEAPNVNLPELTQMGEIFARSGYFKDATDAAKAVVKIMYGKELGLSPVIAMASIHIIEGKPTLSANLMAAMVKRSGKYDYRVVTLTNQACSLEFSEGGNVVGLSEFTIEDAKRALVVKQYSNWEKYPKNMCFARAMSNGVKMYCPDLSMCPIYNPEELGAEVSGEGEVISHPVIAPKTTGEVRTFGKVKTETPTALPPPMLNIDEQAALDKFNAEHPPVVTPEVPKPAAVEYIGKGELANFGKSFRAALAPTLQVKAEELRHRFLEERKFIDADGNPSAKMIPLADYEKVKADAVKFAEGIVPF